MNKSIIMGNLTGNPRIFRKDDKITARFTVAVNDRQFSKTDYIPCVCFGKGAEIAESYFVKGKKVLLSGKTTSSSYVKDGETKYEVCMLVTEIEFPERKSYGAEKPGEEAEVHSDQPLAPDTNEVQGPSMLGSIAFVEPPVNAVPPSLGAVSGGNQMQNVQHQIPGSTPAPRPMPEPSVPDEFMSIPEDIGLPFA